MATHSSLLARRIPGTEEPVGLLSMGSHRVGHDWCDLEAAAAQTVNDFESLGNPTSPSTLPQVSSGVRFWPTTMQLQRKIGYLPWELGANLYCSCFQSCIGETEKNKRVKDSSDLLPLVTRHEIFLIMMITVAIQCAVLCLVTQSYPTLCNPMDCSLPGSSVHGDSQGKNTIVGCHTLLQGIFLTQELSPDLPHCRQILYHLNKQGSPQILEWEAYPFCRESSQHRDQTRVSCIAGGFFTSWATREARTIVILFNSPTQC